MEQFQTLSYINICSWMARLGASAFLAADISAEKLSSARITRVKLHETTSFKR